MQARGPIAFYVGRMGTYCYEMLERHGFEVAKIRRAGPPAIPAPPALGVSDRMLDQTAVVGPVERCREEMDERRARIHLLLIGMPGRDATEMARLLEHLCPERPLARRPGARRPPAMPRSVRLDTSWGRC